GAVLFLPADQLLGAVGVPVLVAEILVPAGHPDPLDAVPGVVVLVDAVEVVLADPVQPLLDVLVDDVALAAQALVGPQHVLGDEQRRDAGRGHRGGRLGAAAGALAVAVVVPAAV